MAAGKTSALGLCKLSVADLASCKTFSGQLVRLDARILLAAVEDRLKQSLRVPLVPFQQGNSGVFIKGSAVLDLSDQPHQLVYDLTGFLDLDDSHRQKAGGRLHLLFVVTGELGLSPPRVLWVRSLNKGLGHF